MKTSRILSRSIAAFLLALPAANAAPDTLSGTSPAWATVGNWSLVARPGIGDNAVLNAAGIVDVNGTALGGATELQDLTFDNAGGVTLANDSAATAMDLILNGGRGAGVPLIQTIGDVAYTIQGPGTNATPMPLRLVLKAGGDVNVGGVDPTLGLTISSVIAESGGARNLRKMGMGKLTLSGANTFTGGVTIAAGILEARNTVALLPSVTRTILGTGTVNLSGGTLQVRDNGTSSAQTLNYANNIVVQAGGGSINVDRVSANTLNVVQFGTLTIGAQTLSLSAGNNYRVRFSGATTLTGDATLDVGLVGSQPMQVFLAGAIGGGFGLSKSGAGILRVQAVNTYSGPTNVNGGTLSLTGAIDSSPRINVSSGATFDVSGVAGGYKLTGTQTLGGAGTVAGAVTALNSATLQPGGTTGTGTLILQSALTFGSVAGNANAVNFAGLLNSPKLNVGGVLTTNGGANSVTINVGGGAPAVGTYTLVDYTGTVGGAGPAAFRIGTLPTRLVGATLVNNVANTSIDLNVTAIDFPVWKGALSSEWTGTVQAAPKNWVLGSNNAATTDFLVDDNATFTDLATLTTVNIGTTDVSPGSVVFTNATKDYAITGTKAIAGIGGLNKSGAGKVTITNTNTFTGAVTMNAGTVSVSTIGDSGGASPLGAGNSLVFGGGTLEFTGVGGSTNRAISVGAGGGAISVANSLTVTGALTGAGAFTKSGAGTLTLNGTNTSTGTLTVSAGTIEVVGAGGLGTGDVIVNATLRFNPSGTLAVTSTIGGTGGVSIVAGTVTLGGAGANTYTGVTEISNATLIAGKSAGTAAIPGDLVINAGGAFRYLNNNVSNQIANTASITVNNGGSFGDPNTTPIDPGATDTVANVTVNGGTFASGRNVTPGAFTITGTLHALGGGVALAQRAGIITANIVQIGDGSVNLDGGSTGTQSQLNVGAGGLALTGGTINFNAGPSNLTAGSTGSRVRLAGNVTSTGAGQFVRLNPIVSNATLDLQNAVRTFDVTGLLQIGTDADPISITNGGIQKTGAGNLVLGGSQTLTSLDIGPGGIVTVGSANPPPAPAEAFLALSFDGGTAAVPEPGSLALLWLAACAVFARRRRDY